MTARSPMRVYVEWYCATPLVASHCHVAAWGSIGAGQRSANKRSSARSLQKTSMPFSRWVKTAVILNA